MSYSDYTILLAEIGDSQGEETFLAPSADKQTRNYDTECSNHHPSLSTLRPKALRHSKMKSWAICTNLPVNVIVRLPNPRSGYRQGQEKFQALSLDKQTHNYDTDCSNHHPFLSSLWPKGLSHSNMKWWAICTNLSVNVIVRLTLPGSRDRQDQQMLLTLSAAKQTCNYDKECSNHHPSISTLWPKTLSHSKMKWWVKYTNLPVNVIVRLPILGTEIARAKKYIQGQNARTRTYIYIYVYAFIYICML